MSENLFQNNGLKMIQSIVVQLRLKSIIN